MTDEALDAVPADNQELTFNGIDATTGGYALPPLSFSEVAKVALGEAIDASEIAALRARHDSATVATLGVAEDVNPEVLAEAGWGVIFAFGADPAIQEALKPLLDRRRTQAADRYRVLAGPDGYRPDDTAASFLKRFGIAPGGLVDPQKGMPYYLLIVGGPESIPYRFQYSLDVSFAVGRLHFETVEEYARYAAAVVAAEKSPKAQRRAVFFGPNSSDDIATGLSSQRLVAPLATSVVTGAAPAWSSTSQIGDGQATKANLLSLLTSADGPSLLFTAGHGMSFPDGDPAQRSRQGALLCQDWPGPIGWNKAVPPDFYLSGEDVPDAAGPGPMIAFLFACYGAGTPKNDDFIRNGAVPLQIAPEAFLARLPQRLLGHPKSPALAVVGHVERAQSYSFTWPGIGDQLTVFESTLGALVKGRRVGSAVEYFNNRYAALSVELGDIQENARYGAAPNDAQVAGLWTARNDARNYVILGDPAVRLGTTLEP
jgi:hypothetical protein